MKLTTATLLLAGLVLAPACRTTTARATGAAEPTPASATARAREAAAASPTAPAPAARPAAAAREGLYDRPGFATFAVDGRIWVFRDGSAELAAFRAGAEPSKSVTRPGAGPAGRTLRATDADKLLEYMTARPGFRTLVRDGRVWIFAEGAPELADFLAGAEPAKHVTFPGAGPAGITLKTIDRDTLLAWSAARPGFVTAIVDGRVWVFRPGTEELAEFERYGEPAKHVTRPGVGPRGATVKAPDGETLTEFVVARDGFETLRVDGRLWVFETGSEALAAFRAHGEPAAHVTLVGVGPLGLTLKGPDRDTLDRYQRSQT